MCGYPRHYYTWGWTGSAFGGSEGALQARRQGKSGSPGSPCFTGMTEWGQGLSSRLSLSQKGISLPERGWTAQRALRTPPGRTKRWREPRPGLAALGSSATVPTKEGLLAAGTEERPRQARRPCKPQACGAEARVPPAMQAPGLRGRGSGPAVRAPRGRRWGRAERRDSQGAGAREPRRGSPAGGRRGGGRQREPGGEQRPRPAALA